MGNMIYISAEGANGTKLSVSRGGVLCQRRGRHTRMDVCAEIRKAMPTENQNMAMDALTCPWPSGCRIKVKDALCREILCCPHAYHACPVATLATLCPGHIHAHATPSMPACSQAAPQHLFSHLAAPYL